MDRRIDVDVIIWLIVFLLLFGGSLIKWLIHKYGRKREEEAASQERPPTFMEEFKKMLEGMVLEERPEIIIVEEKPKKKAKPVKIKAPKEAPLEAKVLRPAPERREGKEEIPTTVPTAPLPRASLSQALPKDELQKAVIMSEILGPPRAKRRHFRLF
ncbi:MAG TPA: hypothetical protein ACFYEM_07090 [Candidatus Hypogeohydataceae bacterium YC40]